MPTISALFIHYVMLSKLFAASLSLQGNISEREWKLDLEKAEQNYRVAVWIQYIV